MLNNVRSMCVCKQVEVLSFSKSIRSPDSCKTCDTESAQKRSCEVINFCSKCFGILQANKEIYLRENMSVQKPIAFYNLRTSVVLLYRLDAITVQRNFF